MPVFRPIIHHLIKNKGQLIIFLISITAIFAGFNFNLYKVSSPGEMSGFGKISESMLIGRLIETRQNGLTSEGGLLGFAMQEGDTAADFNKQYRIYLENQEYKNYKVYRTISGFNGFMFGLIDEATDFSNEFNLAMFRFINSGLAAVSIAFILLFIFYYAGFLPWLMALISIVFSIALTPFGSNLFYCLWAFYLPFLVVIYILVQEDRKNRYSHKSALLLIFVAMILKGLFNGIEFITTILIMMMVPLFFFCIKNKWPLQKFINRFFSYSLVALLGVVINLAIISTQVAVYDGSAGAGIRHIVKSWQKRSSGKSPQFEFDPLITKSLKMSTSSVVKSQFKKTAYRIGQVPQVPGDPQNGFRITYGQLMLLFGIVSSILLLMVLINLSIGEKRLITGMIFMTSVSLLGPFSWFIIFKGHTYIHYNLDNLVWYFPFVILAAATVGLALKTISTTFFSKVLQK